MQNPRLAGRYAKSLMDIAVEQNSVAAIYADMLSLKQMFTGNADLVSMVKSPIIPSAKKQQIFDAIIGGKINVVTEKFVQLITSKRRENTLPQIVNSFIEQYKVLNNISTVKLTLAHKMDESELAAFKDKIAAQLPGKSIDLQVKVDESLIGGFLLESNNNLFDASVVRDLKDIQKQFLQNIYVPTLANISN